MVSSVTVSPKASRTATDRTALRRTRMTRAATEQGRESPARMDDNTKLRPCGLGSIFRSRAALNGAPKRMGGNCDEHLFMTLLVWTTWHSGRHHLEEKLA